MAKILILGQSGSGKSTSIGAVPELQIEGLNPSETFVIACASRALPFIGWRRLYTRAKVRLHENTDLIVDLSTEGNYYQTGNPANVANLIRLVREKRPDIINTVVDDANYLMQDHYMEKALSTGFDVFKKIGAFMGKIFNEIQNTPMDKNIIVLAHYEEFKVNNNESISFRFKTVGKMVQDYITPEGKFDFVLYTAQEFNDVTKKVEKFFITNFDGVYPAKSSYGVFKELRIKNDLGLVIKAINEYEN